MRLLIIIFTFLTLIGCNDKKQESTARKQSAESDNDSKNKHDQKKDTLTHDKIHHEFLTEKLKPIREKLKPLSNRKDWTVINKRVIETKNGNGVAEYYFLYGELRKIRLLQKTDSIDRFAEYYLDNNNFFSYLKEKQIIMKCEMILSLMNQWKTVCSSKMAN